MTGSIFKHSIDKCDVEEKTLLKEYRERKEIWLESLHSDDEPHSIWKQIYSMLWRDTVFRTFNEGLRISSNDNNEDAKFNGTLTELIKEGYVSLQVNSIRKLTEPQPGGQKRGVISLRSLLNKIKSDITLITRENYVAGDGLPYNYEPAQQAFFKKIAEHPRQLFYGETEGPQGWSSSESAHQNFDKISGVDASKRSRKDLIDIRIFETLEKKLDICKDVAEHAHKLINHAADPESRAQLTKEQRSLTMKKLDDNYQVICSVAKYICGPLLWIGEFGLLATPQYPHLKHLDKPLVSPKDIPQLHKFWDQRKKEIQEWSYKSWDDLPS